MNIKRIVIVGAGAVGGCIGGLLCESGSNVALVARGEHGKKIRDEGLNVKFPNRVAFCKPDCFESVDAVDWKTDDVCLIATKLNDAEQVLDQLLAAAGAGIPVICTFNGMQGEQWATERFDTVATIMIWMPSTHLFPGDVRVCFFIVDLCCFDWPDIRRSKIPRKTKVSKQYAAAWIGRAKFSILAFKLPKLPNCCR